MIWIKAALMDARGGRSVMPRYPRNVPVAINARNGPRVQMLHPSFTFTYCCLSHPDV